MKLQELVSKALVDVVTGVKEAQEKLKDVGGVVVPPDGYSASAESLSVYLRGSNADPVELVEFEVPLSVRGRMTAGGDLEDLVVCDGKDGSVSRIKFRVPVVLPKPQGSRARDDEQPPA